MGRGVWERGAVALIELDGHLIKLAGRLDELALVLNKLASHLNKLGRSQMIQYIFLPPSASIAGQV
ncbi:hypothetical protein EBO34_17740 [Alteribacter keqinensis]|uniref:Uncharacterized protein n=1 Tax=Alteribacter keqinensis TaxID=2483800 RepID=A0A3M7TNJ9_9BACI|nr:hypothetical protein EBO34_17740 [Alteribacter keqinensis]